MKNEIHEEKFQQNSINKKNRKILKVLGLLFLLIANVAIASQVLPVRSWNPYPIRIGSYSSPSLQEVETRNILAWKVKFIACAVYIIYLFACCIYFNFSKKTLCEKKRKVFLWLSNCLVISLLLFCGLHYFFVWKETSGGNIAI